MAAILAIPLTLMLSLPFWHSMTFRRVARDGLTLCCAAGVWLAVGCSKKPDAPEATESAGAFAHPTTRSLPALELRDDTPDLLLTWIDEAGDFHVVSSIAEVPEPARERVRVVVATREEGTGQLVYVADLRTKQPDGTYPVTSISRAEWNEIGADRRKVRMESLSPSVASAAATEAVSEATPGSTAVSAIIYGAPWCKPCHDAEALLQKLGVNVTKKDVEESRAAQAEMQQKLAKAGRMGASIPVIDLAGQLFVGFDPRQLTDAVGRARKREAL